MGSPERKKRRSSREELGLLKESGYFERGKVDKYGYGSFLRRPSVGMSHLLDTEGMDSGQMAKKAYCLKKQGDARFGEKREEGIFLWGASLVLYIRAYASGDNESEENWRGLKKFVDSIFPLLSREDVSALEAFRIVNASVELRISIAAINAVRRNTCKGKAEELRAGFERLEEHALALVQWVERLSVEKVFPLPILSLEEAVVPLLSKM
jgi:hypothetical protein